MTAERRGRTITGAAREGRLTARPAEPSAAGPQGRRRIGLGRRRDGLVYVPASYHPGRPAPLVVLLHGAGADGEDILPVLEDQADAAGLLLLAPDSRGVTWDAVGDSYGPDVSFLDRALADTFAHYAVDPARVAVSGFSDGASYALSLGITNGDLFGHVIAFSPGFMVPAAQRGTPRLFISHGTRDRVLPIELCSRRIVPPLERAGYGVRYREFDGGHAVPAPIAREAVAWFEQRRIGEGAA
jgi:phospholipase/carboxylesterase